MFKFDGLEELHKKINKLKDKQEVKEIVKENGAFLEEEMKREAVFTRGYSQRTTRNSITLRIRGGGFVAMVGPSTDYAIYLEYGTRKMDAQPFVRPALNTVKKIFIKDLKELVK